MPGFYWDEQLRKEHRQWVEETIDKKEYTRKPELSESLAVGSKAFIKGIGKKIKEIDGRYELREPEATYNAGFDHGIELLSSENRFCLDLTIE